MLMTGRTLYHLDAQGQSIPEEHVLLGEALQAAGYRTFGTGKWHNGPRAYARSFTNGAEIFFGGMDDHWNVPACDFDPEGRYNNVRPFIRDPFGGGAVATRHVDHITPGKHSSELFSDAAISFLEGYDGHAPFFAYVAFMAPHDPRTMPGRSTGTVTIPTPQPCLPTSCRSTHSTTASSECAMNSWQDFRVLQRRSGATTPSTMP